MRGTTTPAPQSAVTREQLVRALSENLSREHQTILGSVTFSQALKGAASRHIARVLEPHAVEEGIAEV